MSKSVETATKLLPHTPIWLHYDVEDAKTIDVFRQAFSVTWHLIPLKARKLLLKHWRWESPNERWAPRIQLVICLEGADNAVLARTKAGGLRLQFRHEIVSNMPPNALVGLISHELAHAYCDAAGFPAHDVYWIDKDEWERTGWEREREVDTVLAAWGLMDYARQLETWAADNCQKIVEMWL